jgi:hypothetical protein
MVDSRKEGPVVFVFAVRNLQEPLSFIVVSCQKLKRTSHLPRSSISLGICRLIDSMVIACENNLMYCRGGRLKIESGQDSWGLTES